MLLNTAIPPPTHEAGGLTIPGPQMGKLRPRADTVACSGAQHEGGLARFEHVSPGLRHLFGWRKDLGQNGPCPDSASFPALLKSFTDPFLGCELGGYSASLRRFHPMAFTSLPPGLGQRDGGCVGQATSPRRKAHAPVPRVWGVGDRNQDEQAGSVQTHKIQSSRMLSPSVVVSDLSLVKEGKRGS